LISDAISGLQSALNDLMDELNASTRGDWDSTHIDKQRSHLTNEEKVALDFVLATTKGRSHNSISEGQLEKLDNTRRRGSLKARMILMNRRRMEHDVEADSKFEENQESQIGGKISRSRKGVLLTSKAHRSASPAGLFLKRKDSSGRVEKLLVQKAENITYHNFSKFSTQVNNWLKKADTWDEFDIWQFAEVANGYPLSRLMLHYVEQHNLLNKCQISRDAFINYIRALEDGYLDVPYHNNLHAADVLHATHFMLNSGTFKELCEKYPLLRLAAYFSAAAHDFKHPGTNNEFACNIQSEIAIRYNDISVLENMHVAEAFQLLRTGPKCNFLRSLDKGDHQLFRRFVISMVLNTDMAKHNDLVVKLRRNVTRKKETQSDWLDQKDEKAYLNEAEFLLDMLLHCADLANACRPRQIMKEWCRRVISEFWRQGDLERIHGLPVGPGRDRQTANVPLGQQFFNKVGDLK